MTQTGNSTSKIDQGSIAKRMLVGAAIGLALISFFLISLDEPHPEWGKFWMIRPLIIVPFAGAMGGLCNYFIVTFGHLVGLNKPMAIIISLFVCLVGLWIGVVLGLNGTMWN
ncbi:MAG TPA: potassium transporter KefB [Cyclobacteriaceae bacterium]